MNQLMLLTRWRDAKCEPPNDGEQIIEYYEDELNGFEYEGQKIVGPIVMKYSKEYHNDGTYKPIAYWQPIEELPRISA